MKCLLLLITYHLMSRNVINIIVKIAAILRDNFERTADKWTISRKFAIAIKVILSVSLSFIFPRL